MSDTLPHLYRRQALASGRDPELVERIIRERSRLVDEGAFPLLTLGHLAHLSGVSYGYLREIVERRRDPYIDIERRKADGSIRPISSPEVPLMAAQRWILRNALVGLNLHPSTHAYRTGHSVAQCAAQHLGARWLVKLDLHDFFGSVDETRAYRVFENLGYSRLVSFELARICTRVPNAHTCRHTASGRYSIRSYDVNAVGILPQGAPTSGALANAAATPLDGQLAGISRELGWTYTRYSDDLTFSSVGDPGREAARRLVNHIDDAIRRDGFVAHRKKTRIVPPAARRVVLGLLVDGDHLRLVPEFKRRVEVHIRGAQTFGLVNHADHRGFRSVLSMVNHIDGCLAFAQGVEPEWASSASKQWQSALALNGVLS